MVRQKAVKRHGLRRIGGLSCPLARVLVVHVCARVHARAFAPVRCVYLRRSGSSLFKTPLLVPRHRLKRSSAEIIKGGPAVRGPIDPVNSVTTTRRSRLLTQKMRVFSSSPLSLSLLSRLANGPRRASGFLNLIDRL